MAYPCIGCCIKLFHRQPWFREGTVLFSRNQLFREFAIHSILHRHDVDVLLHDWNCLRILQSIFSDITYIRSLFGAINSYVFHRHCPQPNLDFSSATTRWELRDFPLRRRECGPSNALVGHLSMWTSRWIRCTCSATYSACIPLSL